MLWAIWTSILLLAVFVFAVGIKYSLLEFEWYWPIASIVAIPLAYVSLNQMKNALKPAEVPSVERRSEPEKESEPVSE